jgi:hypothetical protein
MAALTGTVSIWLLLIPVRGRFVTSVDKEKDLQNGSLSPKDL